MIKGNFYVVYTMQMANELLAQGCQLHRVEWHKTQRDKVVYIFRVTKKLQNIINEKE